MLNQTGWTGLSGYYYCLHQFPEEIDETQPTFGGKKKSMATFSYTLIFNTKKFRFTICNPAEGDLAKAIWSCLFLPEIKKEKNPKNPEDPVKY